MTGAADIVRALQPEDEHAWDKYVACHPYGTVFHSCTWRDLLEKEYGFAPCYLISRTDGTIDGILPLFRIRNLAGRKLVSLPLSMYAGPLADSPTSEQALLAAAQERARHDDLELDIQLHETSGTSSSEEPVEIDSRIEVPDCEPDRWLADLPVSIRTSIRKAWKNDLTAKIGGIELLDDFHHALSIARQRLGLLVPRKAYYRTVLEQTRSGIIAVYHEGKVLSVCLFLHDERRLYYAAQGLTPEGRTLSAGDLCIWTLLQHGLSLGSDEICLGGSPAWHQGLVDFKKRWGSRQIPIYRFPRSAPSRHDAIKRQGSSLVRMMPKGLLSLCGRVAIRLLY